VGPRRTRAIGGFGLFLERSPRPDRLHL